MAIIYDTTTTEVKVEGIPYTTQTISHTVTTAENRALIVTITQTSGNITNTVTWNGVSMSLALAGVGSGSFYLVTFYLMNPDSGTHDIVINWTTASVVASMVSISSLSGVKQSGNPNALTNAQSFAPTVGDALTIPDDNSIFFAAAISDNEPTLGDGETTITNIEYGSAYLKIGYGFANAGVQTVSATKSGSTQFNLQALSFSPVIIPTNASALLNFI